MIIQPADEPVNMWEPLEGHVCYGAVGNHKMAGRRGQLFRKENVAQLSSLLEMPDTIALPCKGWYRDDQAHDKLIENNNGVNCIPSCREKRLQLAGKLE